MKAQKVHLAGIEDDEGERPFWMNRMEAREVESYRGKKRRTEKRLER